MSLMPAVRRGALIARTSSRAIVRGGGGGPAPPVFARLPVASSRLPEDNELLWNDGVAPELTIDFDAPNFSRWKQVGLLSSALGTLAGVFFFIDKVRDPPSKKPSVMRVLPYNGMADELGNYK